MTMIYNIQALRAIAAINVVLYHIIGSSAAYEQEVRLLGFLSDWGANGVDIFFVISGFVMLYTQSAKPRSPYEFFKNRVIRIVPIYWTLTLFVLTLFWANPSVFREMVVTPSWAISSLLFASSVVTGDNPVVFVGWTLEWEMFFYAMFAIGLCLRNPRYQVGFIVLSLLAISLITGNWISVEFVFGMILAHLYGTRQLSNSQGVVMAIFGFVLLSASLSPDVKALQIDRVLLWGIPSALIVYGLLASPQVRNHTLTYLGDASYSIYLVQVLAIPAFYKLSSRLFREWNGDFLAIVCLALSVTLGCLVHSLIEKPMTMRIRASLTRSSPRMSPLYS